MRLLPFCLLLLAFVLVFPGAIQAHGSGAPYVRVNNEYAPNNILAQYYSTALPKEIHIGMDTAPDSYTVGVPISFSIDEKAVPFSSESGNILYQWTYDDESAPETGVSVRHQYLQPGTYIVTLNVKLSTAAEFTSADSIQVNVFPSSHPAAPHAVISNHIKVLDPARDSITLADARTVQLTATSSTGTITSYLWDFGDGATATGKTVTHQYRQDTQLPTIVLLRVIDANNIADDSFVYVTITAPAKPAAATAPPRGFWSTLTMGIRSFISRLFSWN